MKHSFYILLLSFFLILGVASCVPQLPRVFQAPQFVEQGEMQTAAHISPNGLEVQYAYAIRPKLFVSTGLALALDNQPIAKSNRHSGLSAGFGYYKALKKNFTFSLYANQSLISERYFNNSGASNRNYAYYPNIGTDLGVRKPKFEFVYTNRLNSYIFFDSNFNLKNNNWIGYETGLTFRFGGKTKFQFQFGASLPLTNPNFALTLPFASFGFVFRLPNK